MTGLSAHGVSAGPAPNVPLSAVPSPVARQWCRVTWCKDTMYAAGQVPQAEAMSDLSLLPGPSLSDTVCTLESENLSSALRTPVDWGSEFQTQARSIRRWLTHRVGSAVDAEDMVQDTFLQAHRGSHRFRGDSRPSTWLYGIALNLSRRWLAAQGASRRLHEPEIDEEIGLSSEPGQLLASRQALAVMDRAFAALPTTQAEVLWLVAVEGLGRDEIALRLAITPAAVRSRLSRARAQLRTLMGSA